MHRLTTLGHLSARCFAARFWSARFWSARFWSVCSVVIASFFLAAPALGEEVTYRQHIRPLWVEKCGNCHGEEAPYYGAFKEKRDEYVKNELGPRMDTYADLIYFIGWPDTGAVMRRLDDGKNSPEAKPGNMYQYLGEDDAERQKNLALFKAWVGEGAWKLNRWSARGDVPGITKEDLDKLKIKF
jgi:hypothetical protein